MLLLLLLPFLRLRLCLSLFFYMFRLLQLLCRHHLLLCLHPLFVHLWAIAIPPSTAFGVAPGLGVIPGCALVVFFEQILEGELAWGPFCTATTCREVTSRAAVDLGQRFVLLWLFIRIVL